MCDVSWRRRRSAVGRERRPGPWRRRRAAASSAAWRRPACPSSPAAGRGYRAPAREVLGHRSDRPRRRPSARVERLGRAQQALGPQHLDLEAVEHGLPVLEGDVVPRCLVDRFTPHDALRESRAAWRQVSAMASARCEAPGDRLGVLVHVRGDQRPVQVVVDRPELLTPREQLGAKARAQLQDDRLGVHELVVGGGEVACLEGLGLRGAGRARGGRTASPAGRRGRPC